jgi:hypothetical protein
VLIFKFAFPALHFWARESLSVLYSIRREQHAHARRGQIVLTETAVGLDVKQWISAPNAPSGVGGVSAFDVLVIKRSGVYIARLWLSIP